MTHLYPQHAPRHTESRAERELWQRLKAGGLPEGWTAWHAYGLRDDKADPCDVDFVFAVPQRGFLLMEVKGGDIRCDEGKWFCGEKPMEPGPVDQVKMEAGAFVHLLSRENLGGNLPVKCAVALPDASWSKSKEASDALVLGQQDMGDLRHALEALAEKAFAETALRGDMFGSAVKYVHEAWGGTWSPMVPVSMEPTMRQEELEELDKEQRELLASACDNRGLLVLGPPGSGKSVLARLVFQKRRDEGHNPLFLCFTRALARELERAGYAASTIGDKVAEIVNKCEPNYAQGKDPVNWSAEEWKRALHLAAYSASVPVMGDVAIVDEAHDLTTDHWILIDKLVGGREVWAFGDESQEFFFGNAMHLRFPIRYMLNATYRTPSSLQTLADMYVLETTPTRGDLNDTSEAFELVEGPSASHDEKVAKLVRNLVSHGVPASSIAVLSLKSYEGSSAPKIPGDLGAAQSRADDPIAGKCIVVDSVRRFKGLERPFIILRDLDPELDHYGIRMRIALTRCLVKMWVVAAPDTLEKDRVLLAAKAQLEREARGEGASPSMEPMVSARGTVGRVSRPPWKSVPPPAATEGEAKLAGEEHSQIRTIPKLGSVPPPSGSSGARTPKEGA